MRHAALLQNKGENFCMKNRKQCTAICILAIILIFISCEDKEDNSSGIDSNAWAKLKNTGWERPKPDDEYSVIGPTYIDFFPTSDDPTSPWYMNMTVTHGQTRNYRIETLSSNSITCLTLSFNYSIYLDKDNYYYILVVSNSSDGNFLPNGNYFRPAYVY